MLIKKLKSHLPFLIIVFGLIFAGSISFALARYERSQSNKDTSLGVQTREVPPTITPSISPSPTVLPSPSSTVKASTATKKLITAQLTPSPSSQNIIAPTSEISVTGNKVTAPQSSLATNNQSTPSPTPIVQKLSITLTVDESSSFSLSLDEGKNQCDALSQALQEGKISSLNMQFNSSFNSYAVYQINGLGQEGQVWWAYKVNDKSPPLGCSHIKVQNNDNVRWTYVGPR